MHASFVTGAFPPHQNSLDQRKRGARDIVFFLGRPCTMVRICDECNYGSYEGRCVICGGMGISDAFYCKECTVLEKDRDGCPKIVNLGSAKTDLFYERKKYGFKKR